MTESEQAEIARLLAGKLIERRDVRAVQSPNGAYRPDVEPDGAHRGFTRRALEDHVAGTVTYGHYLVSPAGACRVVAFDIDLRHGRSDERPNERPVLHNRGFPDEIEINPRIIWAGPTNDLKRDLARQMGVMAWLLAERMKELLDGAQVMVAYSGAKGMHVYGCLPPGTPADDARSAAQMILGSYVDENNDCFFVPERGNNFFRHRYSYEALTIETYPKQGSINSDGFGNLMRLPLGINRKSGNAGFFVTMDNQGVTYKRDDPLVVLQAGSLR